MPARGLADVLVTHLTIYVGEFVCICVCFFFLRLVSSCPSRLSVRGPNVIVLFSYPLKIPAAISAIAQFPMDIDLSVSLAATPNSLFTHSNIGIILRHVTFLCCELRQARVRASGINVGKWLKSMRTIQLWSVKPKPSGIDHHVTIDDTCRGQYLKRVLILKWHR